MAEVTLYRVKVKLTGKIILVYKLLDGGYCDRNDCQTTYSKESLEFL